MFLLWRSVVCLFCQRCLFVDLLHHKGSRSALRAAWIGWTTTLFGHSAENPQQVTSSDVSANFERPSHFHSSLGANGSKLVPTDSIVLVQQLLFALTEVIAEVDGLHDMGKHKDVSQTSKVILSPSNQQPGHQKDLQYADKTSSCYCDESSQQHQRLGTVGMTPVTSRQEMDPNTSEDTEQPGEGLKDWPARYEQLKCSNIKLLEQLSALRAESERALAVQRDRAAEERALAESRLRAMAEERAALAAALQSDPESQAAATADLLHRQAFLMRYNVQLEDEITELREGREKDRARLEKAQSENLNLSGKTKVLERCLDALRSTNAGLFIQVQALETRLSASLHRPSQEAPPADTKMQTKDSGGGGSAPATPKPASRAGKAAAGAGSNSRGAACGAHTESSNAEVVWAADEDSDVQPAATGLGSGAPQSPARVGERPVPAKNLSPPTAYSKPVSAKRLVQSDAFPSVSSPHPPNSGGRAAGSGTSAGRPVPAKTLSPAPVAGGASPALPANMQKLWPFSW